jgi:hypothetical protein
MKTRGLVFLGLLLLDHVARAQPGGCEERLAWVDARLARAEHDSEVWSWGWGTAGVVGFAAQLALVPAFQDRDRRIDLEVGAGATIFLLEPVLMGPTVEDADPNLARADCPTRLSDADRRLKAAAESQRHARATWLHFGNVGFNIGVGLLLGLGWGHWSTAVLNGAVGIAVGEAQILTVPTSAIEAVAAPPGVTLAPMAAPGGAGLVVGVRF